MHPKSLDNVFVRRLALAFVIAVGSCLLSPSTANACWSCETPQDAPDEAIKKYSIVFIGTVQSKNGEQAVFSVQENFGAALKGTVTMNQSGLDCNFRFERGKTYLVYTKPDEKGYLAAAILCSRTTELSNAEADLRFLRSKRAESH